MATCRKLFPSACFNIINLYFTKVIQLFHAETYGEPLTSAPVKPWPRRGWRQPEAARTIRARGCLR